MLRERVLVALVLIPIGALIIYLGGWVFGIAIALILALAAWEYGGLFRKAGLRPAMPLLVIGAAVLAITRNAFGFTYAPIVLSAICLFAMSWHIVDFEKGAPRSGTDLAITLSGVVYVGWLGAYLISLRQLPGGLWWFLIAYPALWLADSAAYFFGKAFGRHRMTPRLSPNKSWEGYGAGVIAGTITGALVAIAWGYISNPGIDMLVWRGVIIGGIVSILAPLGDLGISMFKRELDVKDTGKLLPGHGGVLDRIDSWLWAGVIAFYLVYLLAEVL
jgi:phosphatidate cytidylyltransferase